MVPTSPEMPGAMTGEWVLEALQFDPRPKLILWADSDPILPLETGERFAAAIGSEVAHVIADAGHFLQEDAGPQIGELIAGWLGSARPTLRPSPRSRTAGVSRSRSRR